MIASAFLLCAMALPASHFTRPPMVHWQMAKSEEEQLRDWIRENNPDAQVHISPAPPEDEHRWERAPMTWNGNGIWIKPKPKTEQRMVGVSA
jgi:hypothetical protein